MPVQAPVDMSAAWLAHAPPPPPTTTARKPRRSSSYEPLSAQKSGVINDTNTAGGYLPPSSHSPEPPRQRRTSVDDLKNAASSSTPSSPVKRVRSKVTSNPPAPSAFYNYQHKLQQQKQQQQKQQQQQAFYQQQQPQPPVQVYAHAPQMTTHDAAYGHAAPPPPPPSVQMAQSSSESGPGPVYSGYARVRRDSAPAVTYSVPQPPNPVTYAPQPPFNHAGPQPQPATYGHVQAAPPVGMPVYSAGQTPVSYAPSHVMPAVQYTYAPQQVAAVVPNVQYAAIPQQQQPWMEPPQSIPSAYYTGVPVPPTSQAPQPLPQPWSQPGHGIIPPQTAPVALPTSPAPAPAALPPNGHTFPPMQVISQPLPATNGAAAPLPHPAYVTDLSRQSTTSSVASVRRPLPQPTRTSSTSSAPDSPVTGVVGLTNRASVRRDLPRPPAGASATISAASSIGKSDPGSPGSPLAGTTSRLPTGALNRTESVRLAAEALMARGVPQRRPLRSALASTTFSPPMPSSRLADSLSTPSRELPAGQSEPATAMDSPTARVAAQVARATDASARWSQNAGSVVMEPQGSPSIQIAQSPERAAPSAPARFQDAMQQVAPPANHEHAPRMNQRNEPARYQETSQLADTMAQMSIDQDSSARQSPNRASAVPTLPSFSFDAPEEEPEKPRRRRGSSVSRARPVPGKKVIQQAPPPPAAVPTIVLPGGDDDDDDQFGPSIQISGPDGGGSAPPTISISGDDDDARSQTSDGSRKPSISVSFSAEPLAKSQRAGTSQAAGSPYSRSGPDNSVSASAVGSGSGCRGCGKWIAGKVVHALRHTFHPGCFVCAHCSEGLEHVAFYEHEGLPYCHFDYHELFSKRCFHCRTPIVDERYITVQDPELTHQDGETKERCYHELHFFCANCGDPFLDPKAAGSAAGSDPGLMTADENGKVKHGGMEFIVHKGYPYCEGCHVKMHKPRCSGCRTPIVGDLIAALGGKWHPECFTCTKCQRPFEDTQFFVKDGKPYDENCYKILLRNMV